MTEKIAIKQQQSFTQISFLKYFQSQEKEMDALVKGETMAEI